MTTLEIKEPLELVLKSNTEKIVAYACGVCRIVKPNREMAVECCAPMKCCGCNGDILERRYFGRCFECMEKDKEERHEKRLNSCIPWSEYHEEQFFDDENFYTDLDSLFDNYTDDPEACPECVEATEQASVNFDMDRFIEDYTEDFGDEFVFNATAEEIAKMKEIIDEFFRKGISKTWLVPSGAYVDIRKERQAFVDERKKELEDDE